MFRTLPLLAALLLAFAATSVPARAEDLTEDDKIEMQRAREELNQLMAEMKERDAVKMINRFYDNMRLLDQDVEERRLVAAIRFVSRFSYMEVVERLLDLLHDEFKRNLEANHMILKACLEGLALVGTDWDSVQLQQIELDADERFGTSTLYQRNIKPLFAQAYQFMRQRFRPRQSTAVIEEEILSPILGGKPADINALLIKAPEPQILSGPQVIGQAGQKQEFPLVQLKTDESVEPIHPAILRRREIEACLKTKIKGQPEVIKRLMKIEMRNSLFGERKVPEVLMLMGLPGVGKDTTAMAYVDCILGATGAHADHLYVMPVQHDMEEAWSLMGSGTGYIGSDEISPFVIWLVDHSGGRYIFNKKGGIEENPNWQPGMTLEGYFSPERSAVFVNEFHNWARAAKDALLKQALETGYFKINNPRGGLDKIYVPVNFIIASNDGMGLVTSRDVDGTRFGKPLTFEQMQQKWEKASKDPDLLRQELVKSSGRHNGRSQLGFSEELLNRIPNRAMILMRPLQESVLREILEMKFEELRRKLKRGDAGRGEIAVSFSEELVDYAFKFHLEPEAMARPMENKVVSLVEDAFFELFESGKLQLSKKDQNFHLTVEKMADNTAYLVVQLLGEAKDGKAAPVLRSIRQLIEPSLVDRPAEPLTDEQIDRMLSLKDRLKKRVFGIDPIADRIAEAIVTSEHGRNPKAKPDQVKMGARKFMLMGLPATGKTELAKTIADEHTGNEDNLVRMDFNQVQSHHDFKAFITGLHDPTTGGCIPSEFMKQWDRSDGKFVLYLNETANTPEPLLKGLYDLLDEPVVRFCDGKARSMEGVVVLLDGNAGEEWYQAVKEMSGVPLLEKMQAFQEIYKKTSADPDLQRRTLHKRYSPALLSRVDTRNIFFMPPLNFKSLRQMVQLKLGQSIKNLASTEGRRGWKLEFLSEALYQHLVKLIEEKAFVIEDQGRSIDRFIKEDIEKRLEFKLLEAKIPSGKRVALVSANFVPGNSETPGQLEMTFLAEGRKEPIKLNALLQKRKDEPKVKDDDRVFTAYHEVGHELVTKILFGDAYESDFITVVPGVAEFGGHWLRYLGLASSEEKESVQYTRAVLVRQIAIYAGGEVAQTLVSKGARHDSGKSNDMERATHLALHGVLNWGLSEKFGRRAIDMHHQDPIAYLQSLSESERRLAWQEVNKMLQEGRDIARNILLANYDNAFVPLSRMLAERGRIDRPELLEFYEKHKLVMENQTTGLFNRLRNWSWGAYVAAASPYVYRKVARDAEFLPSVKAPTSVAKIEEITASAKAAQVASVPLPEKLPILVDRHGFESLDSLATQVISLNNCGQRLAAAK